MSIVRDRKGSRPDAGKATTCDWGGGMTVRFIPSGARVIALG